MVDAGDELDSFLSCQNIDRYRRLASASISDADRVTLLKQLRQELTKVKESPPLVQGNRVKKSVTNG